MENKSKADMIRDKYQVVVRDATSLKDYEAVMEALDKKAKDGEALDEKAKQ